MAGGYDERGGSARAGFSVFVVLGRLFRRSVSMFLSSSHSLRFSAINSSTATVRTANVLAALYTNAVTETAGVYNNVN